MSIPLGDWVTALGFEGNHSKKRKLGKFLLILIITLFDNTGTILGKYVIDRKNAIRLFSPHCFEILEKGLLRLFNL